MENKKEQFNYLVRPVKRKDSKRIWEMRNHPLSRKVSNNPEEIPLESHLKWFEEKYFTGQDNHCFVLENDKKEVIGYCRFDFNNGEKVYIISIALDLEFHGQGMGHYLLATSLAKIGKNQKILADIRKKNIPAIKLFQKNNFKIYKEDKTNYYLKYEHP